MYDSSILYDAPFLTYDGATVAFAELPVKDALYRELQYGAVLSGLVPQSNIKLDMRNTPDRLYPFVVFRRITSSENVVRYVRERVEIEVIAARSQEALLDDIRDALLAEFAGQQKTWGQFTSDGVPDPETGLRMRCLHVSTVEGYSNDLQEKTHIHIFLFSYIRG